MYRNAETGQVLSDEDVDAIVTSWTDGGYNGRPRECVLHDLRQAGFEYVKGNPDADGGGWSDQE